MALILSILLAIPTVYAIKRAVISGLEILNITIRDEHRHDVHVAFENVPLITVVIIYIVCNVLLKTYVILKIKQNNYPDS